MREKVKDTARLQHIAEAIDDILEFVENQTFDSFRVNKLLKHALYRNLTIIGEAAYMLTTEFRENHTEINWKQIIGMRHVLVHGYYVADDTAVWKTIENDIPKLKSNIQKINQ